LPSTPFYSNRYSIYRNPILVKSVPLLSIDCESKDQKAQARRCWRWAIAII